MYWSPRWPWARLCIHLKPPRGWYIYFYLISYLMLWKTCIWSKDFGAPRTLELKIFGKRKWGWRLFKHCILVSHSLQQLAFWEEVSMCTGISCSISVLTGSGILTGAAFPCEAAVCRAEACTVGVASFPKACTDGKPSLQCFRCRATLFPCIVSTSWHMALANFPNSTLFWNNLRRLEVVKTYRAILCSLGHFLLLVRSLVVVASTVTVGGLFWLSPVSCAYLCVCRHTALSHV